MPYNEEIAIRVRAGLNGVNHIEEKRMFGGIAFMYKNKMSVGVIKDDLCVRVVGEKIDEIMNRETVRPMDFTNKPLKEFIYVSQDGFKSGEALQEYIELGLEHAERASSK